MIMPIALTSEPEAMKVAKGFKVELLYTVPQATQGSWVALCADPKGRLVASDQYGGLYRIVPGKGRRGDHGNGGGEAEGGEDAAGEGLHLRGLQ